ncbi:MAG TPA: alanine--tRNA ligase [Mycobacteriales bacterium]|nr:alanine--tRNA ligase [Mycobacteriales bacterium]
MRSADIRERFLRFFEENGHTVVPSSSLISPDPTTLFNIAGMAPFKPYFIGEAPAPWRRATSVQKCFRTLDIDEVGKTTRHASFFQMAGNFSFGDYFKEGAMELAWELITRAQSDGGFGLDPARLWVTVYHDDDEAADLWRNRIGVPAGRIVRRGRSDNFWSMGVPGPCGPCSEIYIDRGPEFGAEGGPEVDEDRYLEFWNLVFMQFERGPGSGKEDYPILGELPAKNIDTGLGLERMALLLQDVPNLYEIDEVFPILTRAAELAGHKYGADHEADVRLRVVADHVRSGLMVLGDGVVPSNEARGYVLRRVLRRAIRAIRLLGYEGPALPELLPVARDCMAPSYPELATDFGRISQYAYAEEEAFGETLRAGTTILETAVTAVRSSGGSRLPGDKAFQLHDTYGFPIDLTLEMAAEQGLSVDEDGFRRLMAEQRQRAKADAQARKTGNTDVSAYRELLDRSGRSAFTGYAEVARESRVVGLLAGGAIVPAAGEGDEIELVLDSTPFYAEGGGQQSDTGRITVRSGGVDAVLEVDDVQTPVDGLIVHRGRVVSGELRSGADALAAVDVDRRKAVSRSHTATHLLHRALRGALGETAAQAGSLNAPGRLRFDFTTPGAVPPAVLTDIEDEVNAVLIQDLEVHAFLTSQDEAKRIGAISMFGEKYGAEVRVVEVGEYSRELCGGTHVPRSAHIGLIKLLSEASIGAGVRRVEALVGLDAFRFLAREHLLVAGLADALKVPADQVPERVQSLVDRVRTAEKELERLRAESVLAGAGSLAAGGRDVGGVAVVAAEVPGGLGGNDLRALAMDVRGRLDPGRGGLVVLASRADGRVSFVVATNEAARMRGISANDVVRALAPPVAGRGGGKDDLAQGGGTNPDGVPEALLLVEHVVGRRVAGSG